MAKDLGLMFHGTTSTGITLTGTDTTGTNGPIVDLGSNTVTRTLLMERRISGAVTGNPGLDIKFMHGSDGTNFVNMPGTTSNALSGFARATTNSYGSTDAVAPSGPNAVAKAVVRTDRRYLRATFTTGTSGVSVAGVTVVGNVMSGAFSGQAGPI